MMTRYCLIGVTAALIATGAAAQENSSNDTHGEQGLPTIAKETVETPGPANNARLGGILIGTYQIAGDDSVAGQNVQPEGNGQLYLFGGLDMGPGSWHMEVRGSTTPRDNGVTAFYGEVNDSVGETLDSNGNGRFAVTQFYYELPLAGGEFSVGLIDSTGALDANDIADNEYEQFLATSFVNNPSIEYPSFALTARYQQENVTEHLGYQVLVSSTGGLADDASYSNVVDVGEDGKGVFSAAELLWRGGGLHGDVGIWYNGADHQRLNNPAIDNKNNYGAYTTISGPLAGGQWVGWAGIANDRVTAAANFVALAYKHAVGHGTLGVGLSRIGASDDLPGPTDSIVQAEAYYRINVVDNFYLTPDLQYVANSGFDPGRDSMVYGLRMGLEF